MLHQIEKWSAAHHPRWLVLLRVALGICLFIKGISFISNSVQFRSLLAESSIGVLPEWLIILITWTHLLTGFLIIIGLLTRWATLLMIPVLLAAVIFVNTPTGIFAPGSEFGLSLVVLLMLIFFFVEGGGPVSLDNFFKKNPK